MGRKPKPTILKLMQGNPGRRPLNAAEPTPDSYTPPCPEWLGVDARHEWDRITGELARLGLISKLDSAALEICCACYGRGVMAERELQAGVLVEADGRKRALNTIANECWTQYRGYLAEFGLSPASRTKINGAVTSSPKSRLEEFVRAKSG